MTAAGTLRDAGPARAAVAVSRVRIPGPPGLVAYQARPASDTSRLPALVCVHGVGRGAREQAAKLTPVAERLGLTLMAPRFDALRYPDYQRVGRRGRGERADLALERGLRALARAGGCDGSALLVGYSGGAQFAHRYAMLHPERVRGVVAVSAGWYTFPDAARPYPYGLRVGGELPGLRIDLSAFLRVPVLTLVGDGDREHDVHLRRSPRLDRRQGCDRFERAKRFTRALAEAAARCGLPARARFAVLPGAGHSFDACMRAGLSGHVESFVRERLAEETR